MIVKTRSYPSDSMDAKVKHHSRANFVLAELAAADVDPDASPILLDRDGNLTEGIGYNVFLVKDGVLKTPTDRTILQGISRSVIFDIAEQMNIPLVEKRTSSPTTCTPPTRCSSRAPARGSFRRAWSIGVPSAIRLLARSPSGCLPHPARCSG